MFYGINITKWSLHTKHYYGRVYGTPDINVIDRIRSGFLNITEDMENCENLFTDEKAETEKELLKKIKKNIDEFMEKNEVIWVVCFNGKYSKSRTDYVNSLEVREQKEIAQNVLQDN